MASLVTLLFVVQQVWEMVAKLHDKELELQQKQDEITSLRKGAGDSQGGQCLILLAFLKVVFALCFKKRSVVTFLCSFETSCSSRELFVTHLSFF